MSVMRSVLVVDEGHHGAAMRLGATDAGLARLLQHPRFAATAASRRDGRAVQIGGRRLRQSVARS